MAGHAANLLRPGATAADAGDAPGGRDEAERIAAWIWQFAAPGYGPGGAFKIVGDEVAASPAAALAEVGVAHPAARPYWRLARDVHASHGDGATTALLLAARLVTRLRDQRPAAALDALVLARRQARVLLTSLAVAATPADLLAAAAPSQAATLAADLATHLPRLIKDGQLDLDAIVIRSDGGIAAPTADLATWLPGVIVDARRAEANRAPVSPSGCPPRRLGVAIVAAPGTIGLRGAAASYRIRSPGVDAAAGEQAWRRSHIARLAAAGVGLLACRDGLDEDLCDALLAAGIHVATDVPHDALWGLAVTTGATPVPGLAHVDADTIGSGAVGAAWTSRRGDAPLMVTGLPGAWTWRIRGGEDTGYAMAGAAAERLLRVAGHVVLDARGVPGSGAWQRRLATGLHQVADHAPGRASLALHGVAAAFGDLADAVVDARGRVGRDEDRFHDAAVWDAFAGVHHGVTAAIDTAIAVLRIDARYARRPSGQRDLRGSDAAPGAPSGIPFDLPADI